MNGPIESNQVYMTRARVCRGEGGGVLKRLDRANPSIQLTSKRTGLLQVSNKDLILLIQSDEFALLGPEIVTSSGQEIPGSDLVGSSVGSAERFAVDGEFDQSGSDSSSRVVFKLDVFRNLNERGHDLTVGLGNLGDDALEGFPEIGAREGEIYDGVSEGYGGEDLAERDISGLDRGTVSTGVCDGGVGVGSTIPLHGIRDGITDIAFALLASGLVEKNVGLSDDLFGELDKGKGPFADLSLEFRVSGGGVDHVDRSAGVLDDTALLVETDVKSTEVFTPPVCGDNEDLFTLQVLFDSGVGTLSTSEISERGMGVTINDEVETLGVPGEFSIFIITNVSHGNDALGQLPLLNEVDGLLHSLGDVEEFGSGTRVRGRRNGLGGDTDNGKVVLLEDLVGLDILHEVGVVALDVCTNGGECQVFQLKSRVG